MNIGLAIEDHGSVRHLVLDAPSRRHALSRSMLVALLSALVDIPEHITGLVLRGGDGFFSAGADFAELTGTSADIGYDDLVTRVRDAIGRCPRVVIAAIEGGCLGAAADLALACDARVLAEDGFLQVPAIRLGLFYSPDALAQHAHIYGVDVVRRIFLLGERIDAPAALAVGLVNAVVSAGGTADRATRILAAITTEQRPAIAATKDFFRSVLEGTVDREHWQRQRVELLDSTERRAAVAAARARHAGQLA